MSPHFYQTNGLIFVIGDNVRSQSVSQCYHYQRNISSWSISSLRCLLPPGGIPHVAHSRPLLSPSLSDTAQELAKISHPFILTFCRQSVSQSSPGLETSSVVQRNVHHSLQCAATLYFVTSFNHSLWVGDVTSWNREIESKRFICSNPHPYKCININALKF